MLTPPWHLLLLPIFFLWTLDRYILYKEPRDCGTFDLGVPPPPFLAAQ